MVPVGAGCEWVGGCIGRCAGPDLAGADAGAGSGLVGTAGSDLSLSDSLRSPSVSATFSSPSVSSSSPEDFLVNTFSLRNQLHIPFFRVFLSPT